MLQTRILAAMTALVASVVASSAVAATTFEQDVDTAINRGLAYLDAQGAFTGYPNCTGGTYQKWVRGLPLLALLEKRKSGNLNDPPQGYAGASTDDKTRMRRAVSCILQDVKGNSGWQGDESYVAGNWLMGLSLYARTGGLGKGVADIPDDPALEDLYAAIDKLTDQLVAGQCEETSPATYYQGMWSYSGCGDDSSTTQFAAAGLAGAKGYYLWKGDTGGRLPKINAALTLAGKHYGDFSRTGSDNSTCRIIEASERGHGYHYSGYNPSLQQTSSGLWVQLLGGAGVNDAGVQAYLRWLRNHYRWQNLDSMGNSWASNSYWYYMWSSMKALLAMKDSGTPAAGNLGPNDLGLLGPDVDPDPTDGLAGTCPVRQLHRDPAATSRPTSYGDGNYAAEAKSVYFDYASAILEYDCGDGNFSCNSAPSSWYANPWDRNAWALLVLQRATGGACVDENPKDGQCDGDQNAETSYEPCDVNGDTKVTMDDVMAMLPWAMARTSVGSSSSPSEEAANAVTFQGTSQAQPWSTFAGDGEINVADFARCIFAAYGR